MNKIQMLKSLSIEDLRAELEARAAKIDDPLASPASESLKDVDSPIIVQVLRELQKAIYENDDRQDIWEMDDDDPRKSAADSVVALFRVDKIKDNGNGTSTLDTRTFGVARNLCPEEPFYHQPVGAFCTGFLVAPDIIATAGHCVRPTNVTDVFFVFGFEMVDKTSASLVIDNNEIYRGVEIVGRELVGSGADWALVRIDRSVTNHGVLKIRTDGKIGDDQSVYVIGHPAGLPKKFAGGSIVRENEAPGFFVANTDTYGGNSGSPVFNGGDHVVEGILVRGETDFVDKDGCKRSLVCPKDGCRGEDCTRSTVFASLLP